MKIVSFFTFCCCLLGVSFLCHMIGTFGMKQGVDELVVACTCNDDRDSWHDNKMGNVNNFNLKGMQ